MAMMSLSAGQQRALAIAPKPSAAISFFSSLYVIYSASASKERRRKMYHRLMIGMSSVSVVESVTHFWGTWAIPSEFPMHGAAGTERTCAAQGFLLNFGYAVAFYYSSLSLFAFLAVRNDFNEKKLVRYEPWIHAGAVPFPIATGIYALHKNYFNPAGPWCYYKAHPTGCQTGDGSTCAHRQDIKGSAFSKVLYAAIFLFYAFATTMMILLYITVLEREKKNQSLVGKRQYMENARRRKSRLVAQQATMYLFAFYAVYFFSIVHAIIESTTGESNFPLRMVALIFNTLQGFFNMLVYVRLCLRRNKAATATSITRRKPGTFGTTVANSNTCSATSRMHDKTIASIASREEEPAATRTCVSVSPYDFSIFDGSNPNAESPWAEFFDDDNGSEGSSDLGMANDEDQYNIQEEGAVTFPSRQEEKVSHEIGSFGDQRHGGR